MTSEKPKKSNILRIIFLLLFSLILLGSITYIGICFYERNIKLAQKDGQDIIETVKIDQSQVTESKTENMLKLQELQKENTDIVAYVEIPGTEISYPVLQTIDNDFYMKKNYKKEYAYDGAIFLDKDYNWELPSSNLLVYGHNNKNGKMFAKLMDYQQESFYKEHPIIKFTTNSEEAEYEIIAAFLSKVYYKSDKNVFRYYYFINAENEEQYNEYVQNSLKASLYSTGKTATYPEQLLTLSTCSYHTEDGRFAVVARKIENKVEE